MPPKIKTVRNSRRVSSYSRGVDELTVRLTHPDRIVYPEQGITKRDLANYYVTVADWMLPHVTDRPLAMVRCPEGLNGEGFFQKHPPRGMPAYAERIQIREKNGTSTYVAIHDLKGLITLIQFGALEIHAWGSRADDVERPDRVVFDLDPDPTVAWKRVIHAAETLRELLVARKLKSFIKTTGGKGLHIVVPIARRYSWAEVKQFAKDIADGLVTDAPDQYIATMSKAARRGKIFIDYLRNERGATAVVAYSSRAKAGAPVSTPISWEDLRRLKSPQQFTVANLPKRLKNLRGDPWGELPDLRQSITGPSKKVAARR
jgi:bifunctional non-homologous end joining protein LigD